MYSTSSAIRKSSGGYSTNAYNELYQSKIPNSNGQYKTLNSIGVQGVSAGMNTQPQPQYQQQQPIGNDVDQQQPRRRPRRAGTTQQSQTARSQSTTGQQQTSAAPRRRPVAQRAATQSRPRRPAANSQPQPQNTIPMDTKYDGIAYFENKDFSKDGFIASPKNVIMLIASNHCPACIDFIPIYKQLAAKLMSMRNPPVGIGMVYLDDSADSKRIQKRLGQIFPNLSAVPTVYMYKNHQIAGTFYGPSTLKGLIGFIKQYIYIERHNSQ